MALNAVTSCFNTSFMYPKGFFTSHKENESKKML